MRVVWLMGHLGPLFPLYMKSRECPFLRTFLTTLLLCCCLGEGDGLPGGWLGGSWPSAGLWYLGGALDGPPTNQSSS